MIFVRVELWPRGDQRRKVVFGEAIIHLVGGTRTRGVYEYLLSKKGGFSGNIASTEVTNVLQRGVVRGFERKRKLAWDLLSLVLREARA